MVTPRSWRGVRLQVLEVGSDPDTPAYRVAIPASWSISAARGFVELCCGEQSPGWFPHRLPNEAERWIARIAAQAGKQASPRDPEQLAETLHRLLLLRQACPDREIWRGEDGPTGFVLNAAAFADPEIGLDLPRLLSAAEAAVAVLAIAAPSGGGHLRLADLDGALARIGLAYDDHDGREAAITLLQTCRQAIGHAPFRLVAGPAGPAEALLGVETAGFAPAFSLVDEEGGLTNSARARLAIQGLSAERALALVLDGTRPLSVPDTAAHVAMHDALAPFLDETPPRPTVLPRLVSRNAEPVRKPLPARSRGFTQKVAIGGHRLYLRTADFEDGRLGEISMTLPGRDGSLARGLSDAVSVAVSIGLQHGVGLERYVEAFAHSQFGPSGAVDGDPSIAWASSPLDYVSRALAEAYLGKHLSDPAAKVGDDLPPLPLGMSEGASNVPRGTRQRSLRLVSPS